LLRAGLRREEEIFQVFFTALEDRSSTERLLLRAITAEGGCATRVWLRGASTPLREGARRSPQAGRRKEEVPGFSFR
jgi:hypothetical protein